MVLLSRWGRHGVHWLALLLCVRRVCTDSVTADHHKTFHRAQNSEFQRTSALRNRNQLANTQSREYCVRCACPPRVCSCHDDPRGTCTGKRRSAGDHHPRTANVNNVSARRAVPSENDARRGVGDWAQYAAVSRQKEGEASDNAEDAVRGVWQYIMTIPHATARRRSRLEFRRPLSVQSASQVLPARVGATILAGPGLRGVPECRQPPVLRGRQRPERYAQHRAIGPYTLQPEAWSLDTWSPRNGNNRVVVRVGDDSLWQAGTACVCRSWYGLP